VRVRLWDDRAKVAGAATPPLAHFLARARRCARSTG
jgi:predicted HD phosphohydrolase